MSRTLAFLSYTRKDDEFFGGYITEFRKMLENAVHLVSGETTFTVFQDVEGIVIGENWRKKLSDAVNESSFLVPMLSPLFFNSGPCREEVTEFLEHERKLRRDDLILPLYFLTSAKLEKAEEKAKDPIAEKIAERQVFDWREKAHMPLHDSAARKAILQLAGQIKERLDALAVRPTGGTAAGGDYGSFATDPRLNAGVIDTTKREEPNARTVLWVDDNPNNNLWERRALTPYGVRFELALDTEQAERTLSERGPFAAIISDMGRVGDREAGYTLLKRVRQLGLDTPYFIYTTSQIAAKQEPVIRSRGAQGITGDPDVLVQMVVGAIR